MLSPEFTLDQDDTFIILTLICPLIRVKDIEYSMDNNLFHFYAQPYYLRLTLSHNLQPLGEEKLDYDIETGKLVFKLLKETPGQLFFDLNTNALNTPKKGPLVEEIDDEGYIEQKPPLI